ncbi:MAG: AmmeMemoRadiSam system protein B [Candidatus Omnitrophica bacterium]|nr:AmmeMemoRadiSam system protein B [Candidatus Omnitrophota bacterium]MDD5078949.1 AmmeMemoRadiSam system protein B [Candidatus Omnitrophota bacterium]
MKRFIVFWAVIFQLSSVSLQLSAFSASAEDIKYPNVAGQFYPADPGELSLMIDGFLVWADPKPVPGDILAIIAPHAGYQFSGQSAAFAYRAIKDKPYKTVVIIGPSHHFGFKGVSVYPEGVFRTPLGDLEVDKEFSAQLIASGADFSFEPGAFAREHSVEVQLPFLQRALTGFKIVPVVTGECGWDDCYRLAMLLKNAIGGRKDVLVVASTDMYHGYDREQAQKVDELTISYLKRMDARGLYDGLAQGRLQLCGGYAVVSTMILAQEMGRDKLNVLNYTNSARVTREMIRGNWTVGYASCAIEQQKGGQMLNNGQRRKLLGIARSSIENYLKTGKKLQLDETDQALLKEMGAFVTLREKGQLRGCIGNMVGTRPLYMTIRDMAVEAATGDPRFTQVELEELENIGIEISVLSPMKKVDSADNIRLGEHGVLVRKGFSSGVFLPQVADETGWSKEEFLSHLCSDKAGLSPMAWKDKNTELYVFTAEIFSEEEISSDE